MKRGLLLVVLLAAVATVAIPGTASAAGGPCRNKIFNDWYPDGKIASTYPIACYRDALKHIPPDAAIYSSLSDDIRAAMRAAIRRAHGKEAPSEVGHGSSAVGAGSVMGTTASVVVAPAHSDPSASDARSRSAPKSAAPSSAVADSSGTPTPILVLGGVALLLIAAGAVGAGVRYARSRR